MPHTHQTDDSRVFVYKETEMVVCTTSMDSMPVNAGLSERDDQ